MNVSLFWGIMAAVWLTCSLGGGALLARLALRMHPGLSFRRLWIFYATLLAVGTAVIMAIGYT